MLRGHRGPFSVFVVLLVVVLGVGVAQAQQTQTVSLTEFQFEPATLTATVGQQVSWTFENDGQFPHDFRVEIGGQTIDAMPGDDPVPPGESATLNYTFTTPGTYEFWCPVGTHRQRGMVGTLTVTAAGAAPAAQPKPAAQPSPAPKPAAPAAKPAAPAPQPPAAKPAAPAQAPKPAAAPAQAPAPKPVASPAAPVQAPAALPRTGEAENWAIGGLALAGLVLLGAGLLARRRGI